MNIYVYDAFTNVTYLCKVYMRFKYGVKHISTLT